MRETAADWALKISQPAELVAACKIWGDGQTGTLGLLA